MRMLASVQKIIDLQPIEGADRIECATVLGWTCVVAKGKHTIGELVVYLEIDSILSNELLKSQGLWDEAKNRGCLGRSGYNVLTTRRFKGCLAQGLIIPLEKGPGSFTYAEGSDLTGVLNITKYERFAEVEHEVGPANKQKKWQKKLIHKFKPAIFFLSKYIPFFERFIGSGGPFPGFIPKTDQTRIQNLTKVWDKLQHLDYEITEKMEGTSSTYFYYKGDYGMCSRNLRLSNANPKHFGQVQKKYEIFKKLKKAKKNIAIQGEIIGPGIQGNYYKLKAFELKIFDIYLIDEKRQATPFERLEIIRKLGFDYNDHAPILPLRDIDLKTKSIQDILDMADRKSVINPEVNAEGIVFKAMKSDASFKAISNSYLLNQK